MSDRERAGWLRRPHGLEGRQDHTRRSVAATRLRKARDVSEQRFRALAEHLNVGFLIADWRGEVVDCNERAAAMFDMRVEELAVSNVSQVLPRPLDEFEACADEPGDEGERDAGSPPRLTCRVVRLTTRTGEQGDTMYILRG